VVADVKSFDLDSKWLPGTNSSGRRKLEDKLKALLQQGLHEF
jgi:hypothetical protein